MGRRVSQMATQFDRHGAAGILKEALQAQVVPCEPPQQGRTTFPTEELLTGITLNA